jgi:hypothetical protein
MMYRKKLQTSFFSNLQNVHFDALQWNRLHKGDTSGPGDLLMEVRLKVRWS